jgi:hypothetical protein
MLLAILLLFARTDDASARLAGAQWREWTLHRFEMTMGPSGACTAGEVYRFSADHAVTIRRCRDGHVESQSDKWSISEEGEVDTFVMIGSQRYHLFFKKDNGVESMRLEIRPNIKVPIVDLDFRLTRSGPEK